MDLHGHHLVMSPGTHKQLYTVSFLSPALCLISLVLIGSLDFLFQFFTQKAEALIPPLCHPILQLCSIQGQMARVQRAKNVQLSIEMVVVQKLILLLIVPATTYFSGSSNSYFIHYTHFYSCS